MRNKYFWAAVFWSLIIAVCCLVSMKTFEGVSSGNGIDKYVHFSFYFVFTILWYFFLRTKKGNTTKTRFVVFVFSFLFGLGIEACQEFFTEDRSADLYDVIANTSGSVGGIIALWIARQFKKK